MPGGDDLLHLPIHQHVPVRRELLPRVDDHDCDLRQSQVRGRSTVEANRSGTDVPGGDPLLPHHHDDQHLHDFSSVSPAPELRAGHRWTDRGCYVDLSPGLSRSSSPGRAIRGSLCGLCDHRGTHRPGLGLWREERVHGPGILHRTTDPEVVAGNLDRNSGVLGGTAHLVDDNDRHDLWPGVADH